MPAALTAILVYASLEGIKFQAQTVNYDSSNVM